MSKAIAHAAGLSCHSAVMSRYRRPRIEGGIFFFTVTLVDRSSELLVQHVEHLRKVYRNVQTRLPFATNAICILPDHLHAIWTLPPGEADFARRWSQIKSGWRYGSRISGCPMRITAPSFTSSHSAKPSGANSTMVEPCWNQPISSPLPNGALHGMTLHLSRRRSRTPSRNGRRMLATNMAATGTSVIRWPLPASRVRNTARSFLQNRFSTRLSAIGLTFQVSPEM